MAMARFADRFRRKEPAPEIPVPAAPASLLSVEPEPDAAMVPIEPQAPAAPASPVDQRPALLRRLSGEEARPAKRFGLRGRGQNDDTILTATPSSLRKPRIGNWLAQLKGGGAAPERQVSDEIDADAFEDIRGQMAVSDADNQTGTIDGAEKRLTLALSKAGWLAGEIDKCHAALEQARALIRDEELRLARLRGLHEGMGSQAETERADLDAIQQTLDSLRRMVGRLDEPR